MIKTCEFVSPGHPDKICDFIADSILDAFLEQDKTARVAVEVMGGHKAVTVSGEITSKAKVDIKKIVQNIVGPDFQINVFAAQQSEFIAHGVDVGGAGDQGIMIGHAVSGAPNFMPLEYELARNLCLKIYEKFPFDGKVQVTVDDENKDLGESHQAPKVLSVVASFQNSKSAELEELVRSIIKAEKYFINPAGEWSVGGFDADSGLSGRKLIVDNYGPEYQIGGGSFSGKDYTKVDRSGAYIARKIAVDYLNKFSAKNVTVKLAYAIGVAEPVMAMAIVDGRVEMVTGYDLTPAGICLKLALDRQKFALTARSGHFGRGFEWDLPQA